MGSPPSPASLVQSAATLSAAAIAIAVTFFASPASALGYPEPHYGGGHYGPISYSYRCVLKERSLAIG